MLESNTADLRTMLERDTADLRKVLELNTTVLANMASVLANIATLVEEFRELGLESRKTEPRTQSRSSARTARCVHPRWWPRADSSEDCHYCGKFRPSYLVRCPECEARACVSCKIEQVGA